MSDIERFDLIAIGGGPAGLAAAINAESERLTTLVIDSGHQLGGQAGTSTLIENYPGFPGGVSGEELTDRIVEQALRFNTTFIGPTRATELRPREDGVEVCLDDAERQFGQFVLIAAGVEYRRLNAPNLAAYLGRGVIYGSPARSQDYSRSHVFVVGGANSAGQAAAHLASFEGCDVHLLVRGDNVEKGMSGYLVDKLATHTNLTVHTQTELACVDGNGKLGEVTLRTGEETTRLPADFVFVLIGSIPKTDWLSGVVERDAQGFIITGSGMNTKMRTAFEKRAGRPPLPNETSQPGVFAAGDVRADTVKRVAYAIGDGSAVVPQIHRARS